MAVKIRLRRMGYKKHPFYRLMRKLLRGGYRLVLSQQIQ